MKTPAAAGLNIKIEEQATRALVRIHLTPVETSRALNPARGRAAAHLGAAIGLMMNPDLFSISVIGCLIQIEGTGFGGAAGGAAEMKRILFLARTIVDRLQTVEIPA